MDGYGVERVVRAFWTCLSPFVWAANRLGLCSYKWVNVCHGARHPSSFNPLWQHRYYGTPVRALPHDVTLCGIGYQASASEGIATFVDQFTRQRMTFERDSLAGDQLWRVTLHGGSVSAEHMREAYAWVRAVFGGPFATVATPNSAVRPPSDPEGSTPR